MAWPRVCSLSAAQRQARGGGECLHHNVAAAAPAETPATSASRLNITNVRTNCSCPCACQRSYVQRPLNRETAADYALHNECGHFGNKMLRLGEWLNVTSLPSGQPFSSFFCSQWRSTVFFFILALRVTTVYSNYENTIKTLKL